MWRAVAECDKTYDGQFYYAVKTVGVYCRPSCRSKEPLRKNVLFFASTADAEAAGYRACKRCRPDLDGYAPAAELAERAKNLIDEYYAEKERLAAEISNLGISESRLSVIFKRQYGVSQISYKNKKKFDYACGLLAETNIPIIDVAGDIGFDSLSAFYTFFKKYSAVTPKAYRAAAQRSERA